MLHAAIPLRILVAIALWHVSRSWRERYRKMREIDRAHELRYPQSPPLPDGRSRGLYWIAYATMAFVVVGLLVHFTSMN